MLNCAFRESMIFHTAIRKHPPRLSENYSYGFVSAFIFCTKNAGNDPFLYKKIPTSKTE